MWKSPSRDEKTVIEEEVMKKTKAKIETDPNPRKTGLNPRDLGRKKVTKFKIGAVRTKVRTKATERATGTKRKQKTTKEKTNRKVDTIQRVTAKMMKARAKLEALTAKIPPRISKTKKSPLKLLQE